MKFEEYLTSKNIDAKAFAQKEPEVFGQWQAEFEQMHPNSFTLRKLNLINPIRRKYQLKTIVEATNNNKDTGQASPVEPPKSTKPLMKPKPKIS